MVHFHLTHFRKFKVVTSSTVKSSPLVQPLQQKLTSEAEYLDFQRVSSCQGFYLNFHFSCNRFAEESAAKTSWSEGDRTSEACKVPVEV